jgi:hypothetical protein
MKRIATFNIKYTFLILIISILDSACSCYHPDEASAKKLYSSSRGKKTTIEESNGKIVTYAIPMQVLINMIAY